MSLTKINTFHWFVKFVVVVQSQSCVQLFMTHGQQHTRLLCPPLSPRVCSNSCPLSWQCYPTISFSATPFSFCFQSFPASKSFPMSQLCKPGGQFCIFSFSNSISNEYSVLISFRTDWIDLLAVQGALKSFLQPHNLRAPILWCSAFFLLQQYLYMITGEAIALTVWVFVSNHVQILLEQKES